MSNRSRASCDRLLNFNDLNFIEGIEKKNGISNIPKDVKSRALTIETCDRKSVLILR